MTEPTDPPAEAEPAAKPPSIRWVRGGLEVAGFLVLAGAIAFLWLRPPPVVDTSDTDQRLAAIEARLTRLEQRPVPAAAAPAPDLTALRARIADLEQRPGGDAEVLAARLTALEQATTKAMRLQAAAVALAAGRKLGDIPNAPPALARFANANPPTEAALRLAYPAAERAALEAGQAPDDDRPFWKRLLTRLEDLVVVRQGDRVVVGDPAAGVLSRARTALRAGDLTGATAALSGLRGPAATAMAAWLADAIALRDARTALVDLESQP
jgi:hypothetical protein